MFNDNPDSSWYREFDELGVSRVRGALAGPGWDREKKQAARQWLDRQDKMAWQAGRKDSPARGTSLGERLRTSKWWLYVLGVILVFVLADRIF